MTLPPRLAAAMAADRRAAALAQHPPPAELDYLADRIGPEATLAVVEQFGGTRIPIPRHPNQGSKLARAIGLAATQALSEWRGGEDVKIPLAKVWRIRLYRAEGCSYTEIARRLGMGESAVHKHLQLSGQTRPAQASLFD
ncbi:sigma factor-like helix-turn-helix DNA-binding protein [Falsiroseomonas sp.]|uniref:sigma-70 region 4 domain-containing protein n=1 Tax=Falsiroseomonas sp. TaxID=2870721 RepID=UPI003F6EB884